MRISVALSLYDRHIPFFDGTVRPPPGLELEALQVGQSTPLRDGVDRHERMLAGEFDAAELSFSSYLMARDRGIPVTAIPIFPRRLFSPSQIYVNAAAGIREPKDLAGKRVGLRSFQTTLSLLARGDLQAEYGVPWRSVRWVASAKEKVAFDPGEGVSIERLPPGAKMGDLVASGELDALIMPHPPRSVLEGPGRVQRLFADPRAEEVAYLRRNGFYPIMHVVAVREALAEREPWLPRALFDLFREADAASARYWDDPNWCRLAWGRHAYEEERALGIDLWPAGVAANRANIERLVGYSLDQGLIGRQLTPGELFAPSVRDT